MSGLWLWTIVAVCLFLQGGVTVLRVSLHWGMYIKVRDTQLETVRKVCELVWGFLPVLPSAAIDRSELEGLPVPGTEPQEGLEKQTWLSFEVTFTSAECWVTTSSDCKNSENRLSLMQIIRVDIFWSTKLNCGCLSLLSWTGAVLSLLAHSVSLRWSDGAIMWGLLMIFFAPPEYLLYLGFRSQPCPLDQCRVNDYLLSVGRDWIFSLPSFRCLLLSVQLCPESINRS